MKTLIIVVFLSFPIFGQDQDLIIGTWIPEGDNVESRWVFTKDGKCIWYSQNKTDKVFLYTLSIVSPQCGKTVDVGPEFKYLILENQENSTERYCYEFAGITDQSLSLNYLGNLSAKPSLFTRWQ